LNNRDIIKYITCLGCDKAFEVKPFIKHCRDCRLSNQVPHIDGFKYWKNDQLSDTNNEETDGDRNPADESRATIRSQNYQIQVRNTSTSQTRKDRILSTPLHSEKKINTVKSNPDLHSDISTRRKLNRERINSQVYIDPNESTNVNQFYEPIDKNASSDQKGNLKARQCRSPATRSKFKYSIYDETSENVNDEMDELSISNKGREDRKNTQIKSFRCFNNDPNRAPLNKSESQMLREEMEKIKKENADIISQFRELKNSHAMTLENKTENEQSMYNEIQYLNARLGGGEARPFDLDSDTKSQNSQSVFDLNDIRRDSYAKPLSEYAESATTPF